MRHVEEALKRLAESLRGEKGIIARLRDAVARMVEYFKNRGNKEGVRRMKAADKLLAEFESALKEGDGVNESAIEADVPTDNVGNIDFSHRTYHDYKDDDGNDTFRPTEEAAITINHVTITTYTAEADTGLDTVG